MPAWRGNPNNPVPNGIQADITRSEKRIEDNRSENIRRDTDTQKDQKITLMDIDKVIFHQLEKMQITVIDEGNKIKVPVFYGSPEKWVAARRDGFIRDNQGKIQLPAMIFQRTNSDNNDDIEIFHKFVDYPVIRKFSPKNRYTRFSLLTNEHVPTNEVYSIKMADHMILTYNFVVWTEYHEQMNPIIEAIKYNTKDYWGDSRWFRFLCKTNGFNHSTELTVDDDRMVRTEFNLTLNGYILPEKYQVLDQQSSTTEKAFTAKRVIVGQEVTETDLLNGFNYPDGKWKSKKYPNLDKSQEPLSPAAGTRNTISPQQLFSLARNASSTIRFDGSSPGTANILWRDPPTSADSPGEEGWVSQDGNYFYVYTNGSWKRMPLANFT